MGKVPVYINGRVREHVDPERARVLAEGVNVRVVRKRKTQAIQEIHLAALIDDAPARSSGGGPGYTYREQLGGHDVVMLKRCVGLGSGFVRWSDEDRFNPRRFNPDRVPPPLRRS